MGSQPRAVADAEEVVRKDAADTMHHHTTSDLSARLMCRVGVRELALVLAHYDQLKQAAADREDAMEHRAEDRRRASPLEPDFRRIG